MVLGDNAQLSYLNSGQDIGSWWTWSKALTNPHLCCEVLFCSTWVCQCWCHVQLCLNTLSTMSQLWSLPLCPWVSCYKTTSSGELSSTSPIPGPLMGSGFVPGPKKFRSGLWMPSYHLSTANLLCLDTTLGTTPAWSLHPRQTLL